MAKIVDTKEYLDMVCQLLDERQTSVPVPVAGSSMTPFLHPGDTVYLDRPAGPPRRGDIVLYTRASGRYVLHRILRANADGSFIIVGDAQVERERLDGAHRIHGRVTRALHRGKTLTPRSLRWRFFASVWLWVLPWRRRIIAIVTKIKKKTR